jgi:hypothetical protein
VPYRFTTVKENALVDSTAPTVAHPAPENLVVSDNWQNGGRTHNPETMTLVKFPIRRCRRIRTPRCLNISCGSTAEKWKPTARIRSFLSGEQRLEREQRDLESSPALQLQLGGVAVPQFQTRIPDGGCR